MIQLLEQERESRRRATIEQRLAMRHQEVAPFYSAFVDGLDILETDRPFMPNLYDACRLPCLNELMSADDANTIVTEDRFATIKERLVLEAHVYIAQVKRELCEMLHFSRGPSDDQAFLPSSDISTREMERELAKGSSLFVCQNCSQKVYRSAWEICAHWRRAHPTLKWNDGWPYEIIWDQVLNSDLTWDQLMSPENASKRTAFVEALKGEEKRRRMVEALGLSADATHDELDALIKEGRLVCTCKCTRLPPPAEMTWSKLVNCPPSLFVFDSDHLSTDNPPPRRAREVQRMDEQLVSHSPLLHLL